MTKTDLSFSDDVKSESTRPTDSLKAGGVKTDQDKLRWSLLPWDALEEVVRVLEFGATKYEARNWEKGMDWDRIFDAGIRHKVKWWQHRETNAPDSNLKHLAHEACNALFALAYEIRNIGNDTRPTVNRP